MSILTDSGEHPALKAALDLIQASVTRKRLVATGIRWGQTHDDVDSLIVGRLAEVGSSVAVLEAQVTKYRDEMSADTCLSTLETIDEALGRLLRARAAVLR